MGILRSFAVYLLFLCFFSLSELFPADTVYIIPFPGCDPKLMFYDELGLSDEYAKPYCKLREALENKGYRVKFVEGKVKLDKRAIVISLNNILSEVLSGMAKVTKSKKRFLFVFEPPVVTSNFYEEYMSKYFDKIFVLLDDRIDNKTFYKFHYPQPRLVPINKKIPFADKKFCALIARNKKSSHKSELYSERVKTIEFFETLPTGLLDLFGPGWKGYKNWKGTVDSKWETLCQYKFCICYENMHHQKGYVTEKIFDCLVAKCVPIYWGASNIEKYVPGDCFIDRRRFSSNHELYDFISNMDEETHERYLSSARIFLESSASEKFSIDSFINLVLKQL